MNKLKSTLIVAAVIAVIILFTRGFDFAKCSIAQYDLKRTTEFSWLTGSCMVERANGERIYLDKLRGMEGE